MVVRATHPVPPPSLGDSGEEGGGKGEGEGEGERKGKGEGDDVTEKYH